MISFFINNNTHEKYRTDLERAEDMFEMLDNLITRLVDMTEVKLFALRRTVQGLLKDDYPDPAKVQAETQRRDGFHDRLSEVHHGQLTAIAQVDLEANLDINAGI